MTYKLYPYVCVNCAMHTSMLIILMLQERKSSLRCLKHMYDFNTPQTHETTLVYKKNYCIGMARKI